MINESLPTLTKRYRDQGDIYNSSNCRKCVVNEETSNHLAACPADKETWKRLEEEIAGKVWNSIPSDAQRKVDRHQHLEILTNKNIPEDQQRTLLIRGIINIDVRRKLEHLDLENKVINYILLVWLEEWTTNFQDKIWKERCEQNIIWEKKNGITTKTKRKKRERKILRKLRMTVRNEELMNQPIPKEAELETRKTEWGGCLRIVCDEVKRWIKDGIYSWWKQ